MRERAVTISGMSKTYAVTGWRVGTIIAPPHLTARVPPGPRLRLDRRRRPACRRPAPSPIACPATYYDQLAADYQARRDRFCKALWEIGFDFEPPEGAYYVMAGVSAFGVTDDVDFAPLPGPRHRRRDRPRLELLPGQGAGASLRSLLLLQARFHTRRSRRAAAEAARDRVSWPAVVLSFRQGKPP